MSAAIATHSELRCDVFCRVVDNYGDAAVCWRLAQSLAAEHGLRTRLIIDRIEVLAALRPQVDPACGIQQVDGVTVVRADADMADDAADIAIDAFGGGLPDGYAHALAARRPRALWIILEYLSAEAWVPGHHRVRSPHPTLDVARWFFFPGFSAETGGLLRERGRIALRNAFERDPHARDRLWRALGWPPPAAGRSVVSLFGYQNPRLPAWLTALATGAQPTTVALAAGPLAAAAALWVRQSARDTVSEPAAGHAIGQAPAGTPGAAPWTAVRGALEIRALPFLPQPDYDRLLEVCDVNFVRGEDSLVRALWAARPCIWQLYPQDGEAHCAKLDAYLGRLRAVEGAADDAALEALCHFQRLWNGCAPGVAHDAPSGDALVAGAWAGLVERLPALGLHARAFSDQQAAIPDLASSLVSFCRDQLK